MHHVINQLFGAFIETKAIPTPGREGLAVQLRFRQKKGKRRRSGGAGQGEEGQDERSGEAGQGEEEAGYTHPEVYLRFCLEKENMVCPYLVTFTVTACCVV